MHIHNVCCMHIIYCLLIRTDNDVTSRNVSLLFFGFYSYNVHLTVCKRSNKSTFPENSQWNEKNLSRNMVIMLTKWMIIIGRTNYLRKVPRMKSMKNAGQRRIHLCAQHSVLDSPILISLFGRKYLPLCLSWLLDYRFFNVVVC